MVEVSIGEQKRLMYSKNYSTSCLWLRTTLPFFPHSAIKFSTRIHNWWFHGGGKREHWFLRWRKYYLGNMGAWSKWRKLPCSCMQSEQWLFCRTIWSEFLLQLNRKQVGIIITHHTCIPIHLIVHLLCVCTIYSA